MKNVHKFGQYYEYFSSFGGQKGVPPPMKKIFSADVHELGHEKIKIKKLRKYFSSADNTLVQLVSPAI